MTNYRSLVPGGFYSDMTDPTLKPSVRFNNGGAINGAKWLETYPGFVRTQMIYGNNPASIFETPEHGVAVWWTLLSRYHDKGARTVKQIITRYGGSADYSSYVRFVSSKANMPDGTEIKLDNDAQLLQFAKAMFWMEAGAPSPLHDDQILYGIKFGRDHLAGKPPPEEQPVDTPPPPEEEDGGKNWWSDLFGKLGDYFYSHPETPTLPTKPVRIEYTRILRRGSKGDDVAAVQARLRQLGASDLTIDGIFGEVTQEAVRAFQLARNLDPDGEVGQLTLQELNSSDAATIQPPLLKPPVNSQGLWVPPWYKTAEGMIGFRETGNNQGLEKLIKMAGFGSNGWQWCSLFVNACLVSNGYPGTGSGLARSFETDADFMSLNGVPCLGAIVTMWRGKKVPRGSGHIFLYDGTNKAKGVRGVAGNESDMVKRSFHDPGHIVGYYWPKKCPLPDKRGVIPIGADGSTSSKVT